MDEIQDRIPADPELACNRAYVHRIVQLGLERIHGLAEDQAHGTSMLSSTVDLAGKDAAGDERGDFAMANPQEASGLGLGDPGPLGERRAVGLPWKRQTLPLMCPAA